ncbi:HNH endonuclease [Shewanella algae]|uniref:HNH endonuclease n=1 Tax=Shewanella algae TaxID=38313 RepID=UPI001AAD2DE4|nr:HNH endonuclease [Shewanella algae]MBO2690496.1 HNH endonuclease [Shewanella algae]MDV2963676.1 HNH endonuclease [Shewanella algae]QTE91185.1 HNH endonuclease [Shewanella algae]
MAKITPAQYEPAFDLAAEIRTERCKRLDAIEQLISLGFKESSASFYLSALHAMPLGEAYQRTISNSATRYYLERFLALMEGREFANVLSSVELHIRYYNQQGSGKQRALARLLVEFQERAREHYGWTSFRISSPIESDVVKDSQQPVFHEGGSKTIELSVHERDPAARTACIHHYGAACQVCGFDFEKTYGPMGQGFIHVHHRVDLALVSNRREVNPIEDLIPVCPNCHAMLHSEMPAMAVNKLKTLLKQNFKED